MEPLRQRVAARLILSSLAICVQPAYADRVDDLIGQLRDESPVVRRAAADGLGSLRDARAAAPLVVLLKDRDSGVRDSALKALVNLGEPAVAPLILSLDNVESKAADSADDAQAWRMREAAARALGMLRDGRAVAPLIACFEDAQFDVRHAAEEALVQIGGNAVGPLAAALSSPKPIVRVCAVSALKRVADGRALDALIAALKDSDENVRRDAALALARIKDARAIAPLVGCLSDPRASVRKAAAEALGDMGFTPADGKAKLAYLIAKQDDTALEGIGGAAVEPLIASLKEEDENARRFAANLLGRLGDKRAVEPLIECLKDSAETVRLCGAEALGRLRDVRAVEPLMASLKNPDFSADCAARSLGDLGDRRAVESLIECVDNASSHAHFGAIEALGKLHDERAVPSLISCLRKANQDAIREGAAKSLAMLGKAAEGPLVALLREPDASVRLLTAQALEQLNFSPTSGSDKIAYLLAKRDITSLVTVGKPAVPALEACLQDATPDVRRFAAQALGKIGERTSIPALSAMLPDWTVRLAIGDALEALGWQPETPIERVYFWLCKRDSQEANEHWDEVEQILMEDLRSRQVKKVDNAIFAFIALKKEHLIPTLIGLLNEQGDVHMAECYLNSGEPRLEKAASAWADKHGFRVSVGHGSSGASWGSW